MNIDKEFTPYQESFELKELGFDEPCLAWYDKNSVLLADITIGYESTDFLYTQEDMDIQQCTAPTFSQAFRFFREKYGLYHHIVPEFYTKGINFNWQILWYLPEEEWTNHVISDGTGLYGDNGEYPTQEEAELACLRKLIKIVKNKS